MLIPGPAAWLTISLSWPTLRALVLLGCRIKPYASCSPSRGPHLQELPSSINCTTSIKSNRALLTSPHSANSENVYSSVVNYQLLRRPNHRRIGVRFYGHVHGFTLRTGSML